MVYGSYLNTALYSALSFVNLNMDELKSVWHYSSEIKYMLFCILFRFNIDGLFTICKLSLSIIITISSSLLQGVKVI